MLQVRKLKHQIAEGAASPEALAVEEQARQQADVATRALTVSMKQLRGQTSTA